MWAKNVNSVEGIINLDGEQQFLIVFDDVCTSLCSDMLKNVYVSFSYFSLIVMAFLFYCEIKVFSWNLLTFSIKYGKIKYVKRDMTLKSK